MRCSLRREVPPGRGQFVEEDVPGVDRADRRWFMMGYAGVDASAISAAVDAPEQAFGHG